MSRFPKQLRLLKRAEFRRRAHRLVGDWVLVDALPGLTEQTRLGITVTRRFGKAHERNRFKRCVREAFRTLHGELPEGLDLIIRPRSKAHTAKPDLIAADLKELLVKETLVPRTQAVT